MIASDVAAVLYVGVEVRQEGENMQYLFARYDSVA